MPISIKLSVTVSDYSSSFSNDFLYSEQPSIKQQSPHSSVQGLLLTQYFFESILQATATTTTAWFIAGNPVRVVVDVGFGELEYVPWPLTFSIHLVRIDRY
jgi:hypothetical protein